jgi:hypothetical protein
MKLPKRPVLFLVMLCCGLVGCNETTVSEKDARKAYEKSVRALHTKELQLELFRKVNARRSEILGRKFYEVEYEAKFQVLQDLWCENALHGSSDKDQIYGYRTPEAPLGGGLMQRGQAQVKKEKYELPPKHRKGDIVSDTGRIMFEETEKGWRPLDEAAVKALLSR